MRCQSHLFSPILAWCALTLFFGGPALSAAPPAQAPSTPSAADAQKKADLAKVEALKREALGHARAGRFADAVKLYHKIATIRRRVLGEEHPLYATSLNNLGAFYWNMGEYAKAEPFLLQALQIKKKVLGEEHRDYATSLNNLAGLYWKTGAYAKAEPLLAQATRIMRKALGEEHPNYATSLDNLGTLYVNLGEYAKAEPLYLRAAQIFSMSVGEEHPAYAQNRDNLGGLYDKMGEYAKAEPFYLQAMQIRKKVLGDKHPSYATSLNNLGGLYWMMGEHAKAEPLLLRSMQITKEVLGAKHPAYATALNNLGMLYDKTGDFAKAVPLMLESMQITRKIVGEEHQGYATALNNLGMLYDKMGEYSRAEPLYRQALQITKKVMGEEYPTYARSLNNLAMLYWSIGEYAKAEPLYLRAIQIQKKLFGNEHPDYAVSLHNLGGLYDRMGEYAKAEPLHLQAVQIQRDVLGEEHPHYAASLKSLARVLAKNGRLNEAFAYAGRGREALLRARSTASSEALARSGFASQLHSNDLLPLLALELEKTDDVLQLLEQGRSLGLRELLRESERDIRSKLRPEDRRRAAAALARINVMNGRLEQAAAAGKPTQEIRRQLLQAELSYRGVLSELATEHEQFVAVEAAKGLGSEQAAASQALDDQTAVVGWVDLDDWHWAYVVRRSGVAWVELSDQLKGRDETSLRSRILQAAHYRQASIHEGWADLRELHRLRLAPLGSHLKGVTKLILVAQDWAATMPFEMLLTDKPRKSADPAGWPWLSNKYIISYTPSITTLDILVRKSRKRKSRAWKQSLFALADPPFSQSQLASMRSSREGSVVEVASADSDDSLVRAMRRDAKAVPPRLEGTRYEAKGISRVLGVDRSRLLLGPDANERRLFELNRAGELAEARYVHLATHGFIDPERPELSGLVLSRAPPDKDYDGVLHMREVFRLKLDADLVVLSACQTGLGKQLRDEGLVGLSTAFFFAGTPTVVMSLWNVDDRATALLMRRFYGNLSRGKEKAASLREAKAWLRALRRSEIEKLLQGSPELAGLSRGLGKPVAVPRGEASNDRPFAHPNYWAAFVLTGDPG